jgi:hypothetical protein
VALGGGAALVLPQILVVVLVVVLVVGDQVMLTLTLTLPPQQPPKTLKKNKAREQGREAGERFLNVDLKVVVGEAAIPSTQHPNLPLKVVVIVAVDERARK